MPIATTLSIKLQPPSRAHFFGTDTIGRDILARTIYGGQISLSIGIFAAIVEVLVGVLIGAIAGYYGGWLDDLLMRITEAMLIIPSLFLLIVLAKALSGKVPEMEIFGRTFSWKCGHYYFCDRFYQLDVPGKDRARQRSLAQGTGFYFCIPRPGRFRRPHHLQAPSAEYHCPHHRLRHAGCLQPILSEAYVSFLGLGVQTPTASWGNMLDSSVKYIQSAPWLWFFPGLLILLTVLCINFVGDGLRDALDPRSTRHLLIITAGAPRRAKL